MRKMFKAIALLTLIPGLLLSQTKNCNEVTNSVKRLLSSSDVKLYEAKIIGACIDASQTMHLSLTMNSKYSIVLIGSGLSKEKTVLTQTMMPYFTSVEKIYKKYPDLKDYKMYFIYFEELIDEFGNSSGNKKKIMASLGMTRETAQKVNWDYVKKNLKSSIWLNNRDELKRFVNMLDSFKTSADFN